MRKRGFTLLELLIVLLIIGLALSLISTNLGGFLETEKLEAQAKIVKAFIEEARELAITKCTTIKLLFKKGEIIAEAPGEDGKYKKIKSLRLREGMKFLIKDPEKSSLLFDEIGKMRGEIPPLLSKKEKIVFEINPLLGMVKFKKATSGSHP